MQGSEALSGLAPAEAAARLGRDGPNVLPPPLRPSAWHQLARQLGHFFALMLWAASGLAFLAGLPELGVAIAVVVVVNGVFAFVQEHRAGTAADRLRDLLPQRVAVLRGGERIDVDASDLVVGDVVLLEGGARVPADLRVVQAAGLAVDTSTLTGESVPQALGVGDELLAGTFVVEGDATAVVTATGPRTRLGGIARAARSIHRPRSPLERQLHRLVRTIAAIAVGVGGLFFAVSWLAGLDPTDGFVFAIGVTVALVPEALLPTLTLALAIGAQRMARRNALVRRLESVETLGAATFICTDKTGTLTVNQMAVAEVWTPAGAVRVSGAGYRPEAFVDPDGPDALELSRRAAAAARACSNGRAVEEDGRWVAHGDPMEAAIDALVRRLGARAWPSPARLRFPFDPRRRRMSIVAGGDVLVKGAPDSVLPLCRPSAGADEALVRMSRAGLRVLAVASREVGGADPASAADAERDLELLALLGLEDPPRPHAADAVADCRRAGVKVSMVTGDHPETARAIAEEVGLLGAEGIVVTGAELPSDEASLGALLDRDGFVVARVDPEDKLRIARALQRRGHVVAMTGDGVNDGPALQEADIGIAMGASGSDVARDASDLVLLDDDFASVVAAVEQGRATFLNIRRFLTYHLTDNVAELAPLLVWALSGTQFPLALGVLQILALDLATDTLSAVALGAERAGPRTLEQPPVGGRLLDRTVAVRAFGVLGPTEVLFAMGAFLATLGAAGWRPGEGFPSDGPLLAASGAYFLTVVTAQSANAFACRSATVTPWRLGWLGNRLLVLAVAVEAAAALALLYVPPLADALGQAAPGPAGWIVALLAIPGVLGADALYKATAGRRDPGTMSA
jgi:magnesium-transporting ATPase (P-type)